MTTYLMMKGEPMGLNSIEIPDYKLPKRKQDGVGMLARLWLIIMPVIVYGLLGKYFIITISATAVLIVLNEIFWTKVDHRIHDFYNAAYIEQLDLLSADDIEERFIYSLPGTDTKKFLFDYIICSGGKPQFEIRNLQD